MRPSTRVNSMTPASRSACRCPPLGTDNQVNTDTNTTAPRVMALSPTERVCHVLAGGTTLSCHPSVTNRRRIPATIVGAALGLFCFAATAIAQNSAPPTLSAGTLSGDIRLDGLVDEAAWSVAPSIDDFRQTDPAEGAPPS